MYKSYIYIYKKLKLKSKRNTKVKMESLIKNIKEYKKKLESIEGKTTNKIQGMLGVN